MAVDKLFKKQVIEDWQLAFPQLTKFSQDKIYKTVGPVVMGIELVKLPYTDEYRPHFVIYPLWKEGIAKTLDIPIVLMQYYNDKRLQLNIAYDRHSTILHEAVELIIKQTPISFTGDIMLEDLLSVLNDYSKIPPLSAAPNSFSQASLWADKLKIALYISKDRAKRLLDEIEKKQWDQKSFHNRNITIQSWLTSLNEIISNRADLIKQIEINKQDKKIAKLASSELVP